LTHASRQTGRSALWLCYSNGDRAVSGMYAFDELFTRYHTHIYGYLLGLVGNVEQAQDLT